MRPPMAARRKWPIVLGVIFGVLATAVFVTLLILASILTIPGHEQAAKVSKQRGRPVQIGSVATKLLTGLGVRVSDVKVGAGPGEKLPLAQVERIEVKAALLRAVLSKGKEIEIRSA